MKQVIVVKLDGIAYGIDVELVQEVVYSYTERSLPDSPNFIEGLAYVREQLLPIVRTKRLFGSPFFDLYGNKKVLVLSFARIRGIQKLSGHYDTSAVGIVVDDVIGIEAYEDGDVKGVPSVYSTTVSNEIMGFIHRQGIDIALLNISDFFLDGQGRFKYQRYVHKTAERQDYRVSRTDLAAIEKSMEGIFPFNTLTKRPVLTYLSRLAVFQNRRIEDILKENPRFFSQNVHTRLKEGSLQFFSNPADIYVIAEYLEGQMKNGKRDFQIFVFDSHQSTTSQSIVLAMESIRRGRTNYKVIQVLTDASDQGAAITKEYSRDKLIPITEEMIQKFFSKVKDKELFSLSPLYQEKIQEYSMKDLDLNLYADSGDLIYAPNALVSYPEKLDFFIEMFTRLSKKGSILILGLFEDIEDFAKSFKKYYIKNRLVFVRE